MSARDEIALTGLRAMGYHGVLAEERVAGQLFVVDVVLRLSLAEAAAGDDLTATVDYGDLAARVVRAVESDPVDLIETVAERVAAIALSSPRVEETTVTVHKPSAPITVPFADVSVTIRRSRA
ncbi:dihydroneopterin aldolase [Homoserinibacter sp. GY 40078]|uniref:dihydroneopterin aldolase n=1 Tax=Homoserinibacter sp. GY 40078 TaxID=2603275 RepID=UPI00210582A1|nr:dihydroneopterin aldolase [Homoserinibacter sp. GY 40078]